VLRCCVVAFVVVVVAFGLQVASLSFCLEIVGWVCALCHNWARAGACSVVDKWAGYRRGRRRVYEGVIGQDVYVYIVDYSGIFEKQDESFVPYASVVFGGEFRAANYEACSQC